LEGIHPEARLFALWIGEWSMSEEVERAVLSEADVAEDATEAQPAPPPALEFERLQLLTRFLMGTALTGGDQLMEILRGVHQDSVANFAVTAPQRDLGDETTANLLRYLSIGLLVEGQKRAARAVRDGFYLTLGTTGWFLRTLDRFTNNRLAHPLRRPVETRVRGVGQGVTRLVNVGKREEQQSRALAGETVGEIIDQVLDYVAENPEISDFIQQLIGQQSVGMAGVVRDNARRLSVTGDNVAEGVVRRILRRKSRQDLPASPLQGKRQDMYEFDAYEQELNDHDQ
jgi:hypothetical protein